MKLSEKNNDIVDEQLNKLQMTEDRVKRLEDFAGKATQQEVDRESWSRTKNLEIKGIPQSEANVYAIVEKLADYSGYSLSPHDVDFAFRYRPRAEETSRIATPTIVVRFTTRRRRNELLDAVRARRRTTPLTTADLGLPTYPADLC